MRRNVATHRTIRSSAPAARAKKRAQKAEPLWDVTTIPGLIEALGGRAALNKTLGYDPEHKVLGLVTNDVRNWLSWKHIPNNVHLLVFGMAASRGITVCPSLFDLPSNDTIAQALSKLQLVSAASALSQRRHTA